MGFTYKVSIVIIVPDRFKSSLVADSYMKDKVFMISDVRNERVTVIGEITPELVDYLETNGYQEIPSRTRQGEGSSPSQSSRCLSEGR